MPEIQDLDPIDANNVARWPEGMLGGAINNAGRADEGILARWFRDTNGSVVSSNVGNAFSITSNRTISALVDNLIMVFTANITITGAPVTLNLNGLGAKPIKRYNLSELAVGDIISTTPIMVLYKLAHDTWFMMNAPAALVTNMFGDFSENAAPGNPAADIARLYAADVNGTPRLFFRDSAAVVTPVGNELVAIIEDRKAQDTAAQTLSTGSDQVRDLNTLAFNRNSLVSLATNRITVPAGTWRWAWESPTYGDAAAGNIGPLQHQSFLYNQTDGAVAARGSSGRHRTQNGSGLTLLSGPVVSRGSAVVTITAPKAFEIRHRVAATCPGGSPANFGTEVYTRVELWRA